MGSGPFAFRRSGPAESRPQRGPRGRIARLAALAALWPRLRSLSVPVAYRRCFSYGRGWCSRRHAVPRPRFCSGALPPAASAGGFRAASTGSRKPWESVTMRSIVFPANPWAWCKSGRATARRARRRDRGLVRQAVLGRSVCPLLHSAWANCARLRRQSDRAAGGRACATSPEWSVPPPSAARRAPSAGILQR
jgi:hypothetical protein